MSHDSPTTSDAGNLGKKAKQSLMVKAAYSSGSAMTSFDGADFRFLVAPGARLCASLIESTTSAKGTLRSVG